MKKTLTVFILLSVLILSGCNFLGNETTEKVEIDYSTYIKVSNIDDLINMDLNKSYELDQDIDLLGQEWQPIGNINTPFRGNFKGNGFTISNFTITKNNMGYNGLFGYVEGNIENLNITDFIINITSNFLVNAGGLAGMTYGNVSNVTVDGSILIESENANVYAGLLVGNANTSLQKLVIANQFKPVSISDNIVYGDIQVNNSDITYLGGLIGKAHNVRIKDNEIIDVLIDLNSNMSSYIGGLVGHYFLYDIETNNESLSIDKDLIYRNIIKVSLIAEGNDLAVGGLAGYNQNANVFENFVLVELDVNAAKYQIGLLIGENWVLDIDKNLSVLQDASVIGDFGYFGAVFGNNFTQANSVNGLYGTLIDSDFRIEGRQVENSNLTNISFYASEFEEIESDFINRIINLLFDDLR